MALKYGYKLIPIYHFGEERTFYAMPYFKKQRLWLSEKLSLPFAYFFSKYIIMPNDDMDLITVCGSPIELPQIDNPTKQDVDKWHKIYLESVVELFDKYKD